MSLKKAKSLAPNPWKLVFGTLCIALILISSTLAATHSHEHEVDVHGTCGLCVTAHMAVHLTAAPPQITVTQVFTELEAPDPITRVQSVPHFALFSRPPPVSALSA